LPERSCSGIADFLSIILLTHIEDAPNESI
jgi:hypothetical protein